MKNHLILYHQKKSDLDCLDGIFAAFIMFSHLEKHYPGAIDVLGVSYQHKEKTTTINVVNYEFIYLVDFSYPCHVIESWLNQNKKIFIYDHHKTTIEELTKLKQTVEELWWNPDECGATIVWQKYFKPIKQPAILAYIRDRDLFLKQLPETDIVNVALLYYLDRLAPFKNLESKDDSPRLELIFCWFKYLLGLNQTQLLNYLRPIGQKVIHEKNNIIEGAQRKAFFESFKNNPNWDAVLINLSDRESPYAADICHRLLERFPEKLFSAALKNEKEWFLCSVGQFDVSAIAKQYGGGGHRNAAGFVEAMPNKNYY